MAIETQDTARACLTHAWYNVRLYAWYVSWISNGRFVNKDEQRDFLQTIDRNVAFVQFTD